MANYTANVGDVVLPGAQAATELLSRVGGFVAGCGFAALAVVSNTLQGTGTSPATVTAIIQAAVAQGQTQTPSGVATPGNIEAVAQHDLGFTIQGVPWRQALGLAGSTPIELGVSNARAFGGADANVNGHYITIVGRKANGDYIVSDPNTSASTLGQFVTYTPSQIASARPFWAGVPGPVSGAVLPAIQATGANASTAAQGTLGALTNALTGLQSAGATGLRLAGWLILALVITGAGIWLLIPEQTISDAGDKLNSAASHAAELAAVAG